MKWNNYGCKLITRKKMALPALIILSLFAEWTLNKVTKLRMVCKWEHINISLLLTCTLHTIFLFWTFLGELWFVSVVTEYQWCQITDHNHYSFLLVMHLNTLSSLKAMFFLCSIHDVNSISFKSLVVSMPELLFQKILSWW